MGAVVVRGSVGAETGASVVVSERVAGVVWIVGGVSVVAGVPVVAAAAVVLAIVGGARSLGVVGATKSSMLMVSETEVPSLLSELFFSEDMVTATATPATTKAVNMIMAQIKMNFNVRMPQIVDPRCLTLCSELLLLSLGIEG